MRVQVFNGLVLLGQLLMVFHLLDLKVLAVGLLSLNMLAELIDLLLQLLDLGGSDWVLAIGALLEALEFVNQSVLLLLFNQEHLFVLIIFFDVKLLVLSLFVILLQLLQKSPQALVLVLLGVVLFTLSLVLRELVLHLDQPPLLLLNGLVQPADLLV